MARSAVWVGGLLLGAMAACSRAPSFAWDAPEGAPMASFRTVALDPRTDLLWTTEGMRPVPSGEWADQALAQLRERGYGAASGEEAGLWVDVLLLTPDKRGSSPSGGGRPMRGGGMGGGSMMGGGRHGGGMGGGGMEGRPGGSLGGTLTGDLERRPREGRPGPGGPGLMGDLRLVVQVLTRTDAKLVWYGAAELPAPKERGVEARRIQVSEALRTLMGKVPQAR